MIQNLIFNLNIWSVNINRLIEWMISLHHCYNCSLNWTHVYNLRTSFLVISPPFYYLHILLSNLVIQIRLLNTIFIRSKPSFHWLSSSAPLWTWMEEEITGLLSKNGLLFKSFKAIWYWQWFFVLILSVKEFLSRQRMSRVFRAVKHTADRRIKKLVTKS